MVQRILGVAIAQGLVFRGEFGNVPGECVPVEDLFGGVVRFYSPPPDFFPVPKGVKFYRFAGPYAIVAVEFPPRVRTLNWANKNDSVQRRRLAFPYIVFVFLFFHGVFYSRLRMFYRREPLKTWNDRLCSTNLLNVGRGNSEVCLGVIPGRTEEILTWEERIERVVRHVFWSTFTNSMRDSSQFEDTVKRRLDARLSSVDAWERASGEDPKFMLKIPWPEVGTVRSELEGSILNVPETRLNASNLFEQLLAERRAHATH